jgi:hypothetical protein
MPKITLNLEDTFLKALKLKATETNHSMSELVNDALKASLQVDLEDLKSWGDSSKKDEKFDSSVLHPPVDRKAKQKILSRLLNESAGKIFRDTDAAHSQDFLYGEDGMPN